MSEKDTVEFAKALADDTRQQIMLLCCCRRMSVGEIVEALDVSQPTVSHHLSILRSAGLVKVEREGKRVYYTIDQRKLASCCCNLSDTFSPDHRVTIVSNEEQKG